MPWMLDSNAPIYLQLQQEMERRIVTGHYAPGSQLPGVRILAQEAAVNPNTMQKALQELEREGLVYAQRTSGRFVTEDKQVIHEHRLRLATDQAIAFLAGMKKLGISQENALTLIANVEKEDKP